MSDEPKPQLPAAVHKYLAQLGRKGGKAGSKEDKSRAGKIGMEARRKGKGWPKRKQAENQA